MKTCPVPTCKEPAEYITKWGEEACRTHAVMPDPPLYPRLDDDKVGVRQVKLIIEDQKRFYARKDWETRLYFWMGAVSGAVIGLIAGWGIWG